MPRCLYAYSEATVPKITLILRKAYGGGYIAMNSRHLRADFVFAWPDAEVAVMGPEGAANIIFRKEIASAEDPDEMRAQKVQEYKEKFANPYVAAAKGLYRFGDRTRGNQEIAAACPGSFRREECRDACQETRYSTILASEYEQAR